MSIKNNTTSLQSLLKAVNALPEAGSGGTDTSDATATADKIFLNETAYVNNEKVTGTFTIDSELSEQDDLIAQIQSALANKAGGVVLPELSNPATAENLEEGYELIDGDGNIVVGTHVCSGGGGDGGETITFTVVNNLPDLISVYGKICHPNEATIVSAPVNDTYVFGMPIAIWIGMTDGEERDYYNNYSVCISYPMEGEDGEFFDESFGFNMTYSDYYLPCALGWTEVTPCGNETFTIYCEEV